MAIIRAGDEPLPGLATCLEPIAVLLRRAECRRALERYTTGLVAALPRETAPAMGRALPSTHDQRPQEFLSRTACEASTMDRLRIRRTIRLIRRP